MDAFAWFEQCGFELLIEDHIYNDIAGVTVGLYDRMPDCGAHMALMIPLGCSCWTICQGHGKNLTAAMRAMLKLMAEHKVVQHGFRSDLITAVPSDLTIEDRVLLRAQRRRE